MLSFLKRTPCNTDKTFVIQVRSAAFALRKIRTDRIGRPDQLLSDGVFRKAIPVNDYIPNIVSERFGVLINPQILEFSFHANNQKLKTKN